MFLFIILYLVNEWNPYQKARPGLNQVNLIEGWRRAVLMTKTMLFNTDNIIVSRYPEQLCRALPEADHGSAGRPGIPAWQHRSLELHRQGTYPSSSPVR